MANAFYNRAASFNPDELADGDTIEAEFDSVSRGFDTIEDLVNLNKAGYPSQTFHVAPATETTHAVQKTQLDQWLLAKQPIDALLTSIAGLITSADKIAYFTGVDSVAMAPLTPFARSLLDDADSATMLNTLGAQAADATLTGLAGVTTAADTMIYATAADTFAAATLTAFARTLLDDASASAVLTTLGVSAFIQTLLGDADAATARATIGALSTTGTAAAATKLATARTINGVSFDGTAAITAEPYIETDTTSATRYLTFVDSITAGFQRLNMDSGLTYNPSTNLLSANASSAVKLATARTLALSGDASGSAAFDGSGDATIPVTLSDAGVLASCANGAFGGVGTYVLAQKQTIVSLVSGATSAGSDLSAKAFSFTSSSWSTAAAKLSGTWRFMGGTITGSTGSFMSVWLRIS